MMRSVVAFFTSGPCRILSHSFHSGVVLCVRVSLGLADMPTLVCSELILVAV